MSTNAGAFLCTVLRNKVIRTHGQKDTHTHTHVYIYIYIYTNVFSFLCTVFYNNVIGVERYTYFFELYDVITLLQKIDRY